MFEKEERSVEIGLDFLVLLDKFFEDILTENFSTLEEVRQAASVLYASTSEPLIEQTKDEYRSEGVQKILQICNRMIATAQEFGAEITVVNLESIKKEIEKELFFLSSKYNH